MSQYLLASSYIVLVFVQQVEDEHGGLVEISLTDYFGSFYCGCEDTRRGDHCTDMHCKVTEQVIGELLISAIEDKMKSRQDEVDNPVS